MFFNDRAEFTASVAGRILHRAKRISKKFKRVYKFHSIPLNLTTDYTNVTDFYISHTIIFRIILKVVHKTKYIICVISVICGFLTYNPNFLDDTLIRRPTQIMAVQREEPP